MAVVQTTPRQFYLSNTQHVSGKIRKVFTTYNTCFLLTDQGQLYGCGDSDYAVTGLMTTCTTWTLVPNLQDEFVTNVEPGLFFVAVLTRSSNIYVFGYLNFHQFGISSKFSNSVNYFPTLMDSFVDMSNIAEINCGKYNSVILTSEF